MQKSNYFHFETPVNEYNHGLWDGISFGNLYKVRKIDLGYKVSRKASGHDSGNISLSNLLLPQILLKTIQTQRP